MKTSGSRPFPSKPSVAKRQIQTEPSPDYSVARSSKGSSKGTHRIGEARSPHSPATPIETRSTTTSSLPSTLMVGGIKQTSISGTVAPRSQTTPTKTHSRQTSSSPSPQVVARLGKSSLPRIGDAMSKSKTVESISRNASYSPSTSVSVGTIRASSPRIGDVRSQSITKEATTSKATKPHEVQTDIAADKYAWRQEMLKQSVATNALLKDLIPPKRLITKVMQTYLEHFNKIAEDQLRLPLTQIDDVLKLNTSLLDVELSVSLVRHFLNSLPIQCSKSSSFKCAVQIDKFRLLTSETVISKALLASLVSGQICHKMQWKRRGKKFYPMLVCYVFLSLDLTTSSYKIFSCDHCHFRATQKTDQYQQNNFVSASSSEISRLPNYEVSE